VDAGGAEVVVDKIISLLRAVPIGFDLTSETNLGQSCFRLRMFEFERRMNADAAYCCSYALEPPMIRLFER
jgi:hypothetical protein